MYESMCVVYTRMHAWHTATDDTLARIKTNRRNHLDQTPLLPLKFPLAEGAPAAPRSGRKNLGTPATPPEISTAHRIEKMIDPSIYESIDLAHDLAVGLHLALCYH